MTTSKPRRRSGFGMTAVTLADSGHWRKAIFAIDIPQRTSDNNRMTFSDLARRIDHTILKPEALAPEIHKVVTDAIEYQFASVCVAPAWVAKVSAMLKGTPVKCCTVVGFPHGTSKATLKAIEASSAIKDGATEVDVVAFLPFLI